MGWLSAVAHTVRDAVGLPRPITLDLQPLNTYAADLAPQPVDRLLTAMRTGDTAVTRETAMSVAAVQRGRNELCAIATLPLRQYRGLDITESALLRQFDLDEANVVHLAMTIEDLALCRIAWWEVVGQDYRGYPIAVRRIEPERVELKNPTGKPTAGDSRWVWIRRDDEKGGYRQVAASLMIRFDSPNPGILKANAMAIRIARQLDRLTEMYANNPALREYFTDNWDNPDVTDPMGDDDISGFLAEYGAARQSHPYGWIPSNVKRSEVTSPSPKDLTLVELRREVGIAIANGLGVDPEDLGISTTSRTYQNEDARRRDKVSRMLGPYMRALTDRLSMGDVTPRGYRVEFDLTEYLRPDPVAEAAYWVSLETAGIVDKQEVRTRLRLSGAPPAQPAAAPAGAPVRVPSTVGRALEFDAPRPGMTFAAADFAGDAPAAPTVDPAARTITGLAVPYSAVASKFGIKYRFMPGSLEYGDPARMAHLKDHTTPVGFHREVTDGPDGPVVALAVLDGPAGSQAKADRDQLLYDAEHGLYSGLSVGVDFSLDPEDGDVQIDDEGVYNVHRATWRETSTTYLPAFDGARVTRVAASLTGGSTMKCQHCGRAHAPGIACATFAAQEAPTGVRVGGELAGDQAAQFAAFQEYMAAQQAAAPEPLQAPAVVSPHRETAQVTEPSPYRFDRRGNLVAGTHDFSSDLYLGWRNGDQAAQDRAQSFVEQAFAERPATPAPAVDQQFAITPANVANLNYPANRADLYVDQLDYQYPMYNAVFKGTLDAVTPFVIPKFSSSSGLVADHVTGTEPTPGTFVATAQTLTPSAMSGKVEITREAFDQGGNPQMSGLIWRQMVRAWYEGLEAYVQAQLVAAAASIPDITITTAAADGTLDAALVAAIVPLQFIRGGDRFRKVFTQIDLYKALVAAKDSTGRRLYPSLGATNAIGVADPSYSWIDAHGKLWIPAWATAATGTVAASSWMFDPEVVCLWASAPKRIDLQWRVAWVDMAIWGYKAFGITDFTRTREVVYDPI